MRQDFAIALQGIEIDRLTRFREWHKTGIEAAVRVEPGDSSAIDAVNLLEGPGDQNFVVLLDHHLANVGKV